MTALLNAMERKDSVKKVRKMGYVPGNIYGPGIGSTQSVQFEGKEINKFLKGHSIGSKATVKLNGREVQCVVKSIQYEPISNIPLHIEFYASPEDKLVRVKVPIKFTGKELLANRRLVLNILEDEVEIQGMLKNLPESIEVDVSSMEDGSTIYMGDIILPEGIKLLSKSDEVVASITKVEEEEEKEEEEVANSE